MKLLTRPRFLLAGQTRVGDLIATDEHGEFIETMSAYMDLDLRDDDTGVLWSVVHNSVPNETPDEIADGRTWVVVHTRGIIALPAQQNVITREVIELDPWSYVRT